MHPFIENNASMCNGANLAYERKAFYEVNGFTGIDQIAAVMICY